jgi:hypothetical protein
MQRAIVRAAEINGSLTFFFELDFDLKSHTVVSPVTVDGTLVVRTYFWLLLLGWISASLLGSSSTSGMMVAVEDQEMRIKRRSPR